MSISGTRFLRIGGVLLLSALSIYSARFSALASARAGELSNLSGLIANDGLVGLQRELQALAENPAHKLDSHRLERARLTLVGRPLNSQVYAGLGIAASNDANRQTEADRFMALADRIGRREPISQLWLIEKSAAAGDVPETLRHYNRILSTKPELSATLFPVLATAIDFPEIRQAILPYLRYQRPWVKDFVTFAASNSKVDSIVELLGSSMSSIRGEVYVGAKSEVIYRLAEAGRADEALDFARQSYPDLDLAGFSTLSISPATTDKRLGRFAWQLQSNDKVESVLSDGGSIHVTIQPSTQAVIITRALLVNSAHNHSIKFIADQMDGSSSAVFDLTISCAQSGKGDRFARNYRFSHDLKGGIPLNLGGLSKCQILSVSLIARSSEGQVPGEFEIKIL